MPFPAGGPSDVAARIVTVQVARTLGPPTVIENVGGAGGTIDSARVAAARPDGYAKAYVPRARESIKAAGGRILSAGARLTNIEGEPPKQRIAILVWERVDKMKAWREFRAIKSVRILSRSELPGCLEGVKGCPRRNVRNASVDPPIPEISAEDFRAACRKLV